MPKDLFTESLECYQHCKVYSDNCDIVEKITYSDTTRDQMEVRSYLKSTIRMGSLYEATSSKWLKREIDWKEVEKVILVCDWRSVSVERSFWEMPCKPKEYTIADGLYVLNACSLSAVSLLHGNLLKTMPQDVLDKLGIYSTADFIDENGNNFVYRSSGKTVEIMVDPVNRKWQKVFIEMCLNNPSPGELLEKQDIELELLNELLTRSHVGKKFNQTYLSRSKESGIENIKTEISINQIEFSF